VRIHNDAQVWSVNHLAKVISGHDPMQAIVDLVAEHWARTDEGLIVSRLIRLHVVEKVPPIGD
jgi:hypothetical protein